MAQSGSALDWGSRGRRFESGRSDQRLAACHGGLRLADPVLWTAVLWAALLVMLAIAPSSATAAEIADFYGHYEGTGRMVGDASAPPRQLDVDIRPTPNGFNLTWETSTAAGDGEGKEKRYSIDFRRTDRPDVFASEMRTNMFGQRVPLDPMKGDPFLWARLVGPTLTVTGLLIRPDGTYDLLTYARTLTEKGLDLRFTRRRDGEAVRTIEGSLHRVKP